MLWYRYFSFMSRLSVVLQFLNVLEALVLGFLQTGWKLSSCKTIWGTVLVFCKQFSYFLTSPHYIVTHKRCNTRPREQLKGSKAFTCSFNTIQCCNTSLIFWHIPTRLATRICFLIPIKGLGVNLLTPV